MSGTPTKPPAAAPAPEYYYSFRFVDALYAVALVAAAYAVFGLRGIAIGGIIALVWAAVFARSPSTQTISVVGIMALAAGCLLCPWPSFVRPKVSRMEGKLNLLQIELALHSYHDAWRRFPPAYLADNEGRPMHSWRVLILPFLEDMELYDQYDFGEHWDGPNNSKLLSKMPRVYMCPSHDSEADESHQCTGYVAVMGDDADGPVGGNRKREDESGAERFRIVLIEDGSARIPWTQPTDWNVEEAIGRVTSDDPNDGGPHETSDFFFRYTGGRNVLLADSSVAFYYDDVGHENWTRLLSGDASDVPAGPESISKFARVRGVRVGNWLRLSVFVVLSSAPLPWVFRKRGTANAGKAAARTEQTA